ncbi:MULTISPECIES: hypothetical protein [Paenibacillus]|uniref:hypothetical protein n=1 Tax=Paenibacillus TaxID=44249 RepID=UPI00073EF9C2|nr:MULTISPECIES: hypothetical protein [Paenibacillus]MDU2241859.1 hypothetical protein [Paenibacillus sp.]
MAKVTQADFYFGAALSILFNNNMIPALVEGGDNRRIYKISTDTSAYDIYMKYRSKRTTGSNDYSSWQFTFSEDDIFEIKKNINKEFIMLLICGKEKLNTSEIVILDYNDITCIFETNKRSFTISRRKNEKYYRISMGGGRENSLQIKARLLSQIAV